MKRKLLFTILFSFSFYLLSSQVQIRLLTELRPEYLIFTVTSGKYVIKEGSGTIINLSTGENVILARYDGKIAVKVRGTSGFAADSLLFKGLTGDDYFSIRINKTEAVRRNYTGDLRCFPDLDALLLINDCDIEKYIAGVVRAEGGNGKNEEYFRTQAVIARTYTFRYFSKHKIDGFNLCDCSHCQAFNGISTDSIINNSVVHTKDLVITTPDSSLIISAFHSNCGGETSPSEYVWVTSQPYLTKVIDPYCLSSRNATWVKMISLSDWRDLLKRNGYQPVPNDTSAFNFDQPSRVPDYVTGSFKLPLRIIRTDLGLRSSFFSMAAEGDSLKLRGRGYGHGVGLCQEGAMAMSMKGFAFEEIINFYYPGVNIIRVKDAKKSEDEK
jgi:stage II sporulation protein D